MPVLAFLKMSTSATGRYLHIGTTMHDQDKAVSVSERGARTQRTWWLVALGALVAVSAGSWWLGARAQSPAQAAAKAAEPNASWITSAVDKRVLASTVVLRGDVKPEVSLDIGVPTSAEGSAVVTRLSPPVGSEVREGDIVVGVSGRPVFVFQGDVPVYRTLKPGMAGADVQQMQAALVRLGFTPDIDGTYGEATKQAVTAFYSSAGFDPVASSTTAADVSTAQQAFNASNTALTSATDALTKARAGGSASAIAAAEASLNQANRALVDATASKTEAVQSAQAALTAAQNAAATVTADPAASQSDKDVAATALLQAQAALQAAIRRGDDAVAAATDQVRVAGLQLNETRKANDVAAAQAARDQAVAARDSAAVAYMNVVGATGPTVAQGEVVFVPTLPARVQSAVASLGAVTNGGNVGAGSSGTSGLLRLSAGTLLVSTSILSGDAGLVRVGMPVELLDETSNITYSATIASIAEIAVIDASGLLGKPTTIAPKVPLPATLEGANVRVTITASATDGEVLVVPLAAVSSNAGGITRVSVLRSGAIDPVDVPVTVGISADGFVAVEPTTVGALVPGDLVVVGR